LPGERFAEALNFSVAGGPKESIDLPKHFQMEVRPCQWCPIWAAR